MKQSDKGAWKPKAFKSIAELKAELDIIEKAHQAGTLTTAGGWSVGQCLMHCATLTRFSFDGFEMRAPLPIRVVGALVFKPMLTRPNAQMKPGFKLPKNASALLPQDDICVEDGLAMMRAQIARIDDGEQITNDSPVMGKMTHDKWILLHLNHCRMHFGFFNYDSVI